MTPTTLAALAAAHDLFVVDQYGVLHDGVRPYPGAPEALLRLREAGARVAILSNSGKRAAANEARLVALGFDPRGWDAFVSSGEVAHARLRLRPDLRRVLVLARGDDGGLLEGLPVERVERAPDADLVLISGSEAPRTDLDAYAARLAPAAARGVPAWCVNPDTTMLVPGGTAFGPGRIARLYEELGGPVTWIGKPWPEVYRAVAERFPEASRPVAIGDSIEHDIAGGRAAGFATALVATGIHAGMSEAALDAEIAAHGGAAPDYRLAAFAF